MRYVETELQARDAPRLARLVWPLPVLVPELQLAPAQVRTDPEGISIVLDAITLSHQRTESGPTEFFSENDPLLNLERLASGRDLGVAVGFDAIQAVSRFAIRDDLVRINVLDVPDPEIARFADRETLAEIIPELAGSPAQLRAVLRLVQPFVVTGIPSQDETGEASKMSLSTSEAVIEIARESERTWLPAYRICFSLTQDLSIAVTDSGEVSVNWSDAPEVRVLVIDRTSGETTPLDSDPKRFAELFTHAWSHWAGAQQTPVSEVTISESRITAHRIEVTSDTLRLELRVGSDPATPTVSRGKLKGSRSVSR